MAGDVHNRMDAAISLEPTITEVFPPLSTLHLAVRFISWSPAR